MRRITAGMSAACAAVLLTGTLATAQELNTDKSTFVTFSAPVALPGITLPAGDYLFKLLNSQANRNIVQVYDRGRTKLFTTIIAMPAQRTEITGETVITFREAPANAAPALRYWYFPGDRIGQEFAYPKAQAMQIANANRIPVLAVDVTEGDPTGVKGGAMSHVEPGAAVEQSAQAVEPAPRADVSAQPAPPSTAAVETPEPQPQAQPEPRPQAQPEPQPQAQAERMSTPEVTTPAPQPMREANPTAVGTSGTTTPAPTGDANAERRLPNTGSELPLVGLVGLLALAGAFGVRAVRRSMI